MKELSVMAFNMERGIRLEGLAAFLEHHRPDLILASELDVGCARSGNRDIPRLLAQRLGMEMAFCREFRELACPEDSLGLHGNAIFSRYPILWTREVPLPREYDWYRDPQKRTGGRTALLALLDMEGTPLGAASLHLENRTCENGRLRQMEAVLAAVEEAFPEIPVVMGGDLNTCGFDGSDSAALEALLRDPSGRAECLRAAESALTAAQAAGFRLQPDPEVLLPTRRKHIPGGPPLLLRVDWLMGRDCRITRGAVYSTAAEDCPCLKMPPRETELSDHDAVGAVVQLPAASGGTE